MKKIYALGLGIWFCALFQAQEYPVDDRKVVVTLNVPIDELSPSERKNVVYPGCSENSNMLVSECFTNMVTKDINSLLELDDTDLHCADRTATLLLLVDKMGHISLTGIESEEFTPEIETKLTSVVEQLNTLYGDSLQIKPAIIKGQAYEVVKKIPFVISGKKYHHFETLETQGKIFNVFRKCDEFFIKDEQSFRLLDKIIGEENYNAFKKEMMNPSEDLEE